jgi:hypothetical protein
MLARIATYALGRARNDGRSRGTGPGLRLGLGVIFSVLALSPIGAALEEAVSACLAANAEGFHGGCGRHDAAASFLKRTLRRWPSR